MGRRQRPMVLMSRRLERADRRKLRRASDQVERKRHLQRMAALQLSMVDPQLVANNNNNNNNNKPINRRRAVRVAVRRFMMEPRVPLMDPRHLLLDRRHRTRRALKPRPMSIGRPSPWCCRGLLFLYIISSLILPVVAKVSANRPHGASESLKAPEAQESQLQPCPANRMFVCYSADALKEPYPNFTPHVKPRYTQKCEKCELPETVCESEPWATIQGLRPSVGHFACRPNFCQDGQTEDCIKPVDINRYKVLFPMNVCTREMVARGECPLDKLSTSPFIPESMKSSNQYVVQCDVGFTVPRVVIAAKELDMRVELTCVPSLQLAAGYLAIDGSPLNDYEFDVSGPDVNYCAHGGRKKGDGCQPLPLCGANGKTPSAFQAAWSARDCDKACDYPSVDGKYDDCVLLDIRLDEKTVISYRRLLSGPYAEFLPDEDNLRFSPPIPTPSPENQPAVSSGPETGEKSDAPPQMPTNDNVAARLKRAGADKIIRYPRCIEIAGLSDSHKEYVLNDALLNCATNPIYLEMNKDPRLRMKLQNCSAFHDADGTGNKICLFTALPSKSSHASQAATIVGDFGWIYITGAVIAILLLAVVGGTIYRIKHKSRQNDDAVDQESEASKKQDIEATAASDPNTNPVTPANAIKNRPWHIVKKLDPAEYLAFGEQSYTIDVSKLRFSRITILPDLFERAVANARVVPPQMPPKTPFNPITIEEECRVVMQGRDLLEDGLRDVKPSTQTGSAQLDNLPVGAKAWQSDPDARPRPATPMDEGRFGADVSRLFAEVDAEAAEEGLGGQQQCNPDDVTQHSRSAARVPGGAAPEDSSIGPDASTHTRPLNNTPVETPPHACPREESADMCLRCLMENHPELTKDEDPAALAETMRELKSAIEEHQDARVAAAGEGSQQAGPAATPKKNIAYKPPAAPKMVDARLQCTAAEATTYCTISALYLRKKLLHPFNMSLPDAKLPMLVNGDLDAMNWAYYGYAIQARKLKNVVEINGPTMFIQDLHGDFRQAIRLLMDYYESARNHPGLRLVVMGNLVDHGPASHETILLFMSVAFFDSKIIILRGNHETPEINGKYGFQDETLRRFDAKIAHKLYSHANWAFRQLPLAVVSMGRIFAMHGCIDPDVQTIEEYNKFDRFARYRPTWLMSLLWNDPQKGILGAQPNNKRKGQLALGPDVIHDCMKRNQLDLIVRGHQPPMGGVEFFNGKDVLTGFGKPDYDPWGNLASSILCDGTGRVKITLYAGDLSQPAPTEERVKKMLRLSRNFSVYSKDGMNEQYAEFTNKLANKGVEGIKTVSDMPASQKLLNEVLAKHGDVAVPPIPDEMSPKTDDDKKNKMKKDKK